VPTTGWKLTNHHKTYLSVQCDILCNCCSSVPITRQCLMTLVVWVWLWNECFSLVKPKRSTKGISHPSALCTKFIHCACNWSLW